ncbi:MAG: uroporphyrinogen-III synthase [Gemmatimonadales bacterium]|nr:uroporphyrinogen-III synthase [Gemmatimonadales bacterium]
MIRSPHVVLTQADGSLAGLADLLRGERLDVEEHPLLRFVPPPTWDALDDALDDLAAFGAVALTSPRAAAAVSARFRAGGLPIVASPAAFASGITTADPLVGCFGSIVLAEPAAVSRYGAAVALAARIHAAGVRDPVLFPCGDQRRDELPERLRAVGIQVLEVPAYRLALATEADARETAGRADVLVVASPSVARLVARAWPGADQPGVRLVAIGPTTAVAARAAGWEPAAVAGEPSVPGVAAAVRRVLVRE